jgi:hypothetical protein
VFSLALSRPHPDPPPLGEGEKLRIARLSESDC